MFEKLLKPIRIQSSFSTISPGVLVGEKNYPRVSIGIVTPVRIIDPLLDNPKQWIQKNYPILRIGSIRASMLDAFSHNKKFLSAAQEIAMSYKPIDISIDLLNPIYKPVIEKGVPPLGGIAKIKRLYVSNPFVPKPVDRVLSDELKAEQSILQLWRKGFDEYYSYKLLSVGLLGIKKKIVPTKWSITAIDDLLAKHMLRKIREYPLIDKYYVFSGGTLGNYYIAIFTPNQWGFELFESYLNRYSGKISDYVTDYEGFFPRTSYASNTIGGYYASRLAIVEKLLSMKRQSRIVLIRIITPAYIFPLGVWVVREAVRKCLSNKPVMFDSLRDAINHAKQQASLIGADISIMLQNSRFLKYRQATLRNFFE